MAEYFANNKVSSSEKAEILLLQHILTVMGNINYGVIYLTNLEALDASAKDYFYSLPQLIQEQIIESSVTFSSKQELEKYYKLISGNNSASD